MDDRLFGSLEWRCIGPHRGGRCVAVAGHPTEVGTFYFGACAGGVWKTSNGGSHWENVSDGFFNTAAVGAIAVSDSHPNVVYAWMSHLERKPWTIISGSRDGGFYTWSAANFILANERSQYVL